MGSGKGNWSAIWSYAEESSAVPNPVLEREKVQIALKVFSVLKAGMSTSGTTIPDTIKQEM